MSYASSRINVWSNIVIAPTLIHDVAMSVQFRNSIELSDSDGFVAYHNFMGRKYSKFSKIKKKQIEF